MEKIPLAKAKSSDQDLEEIQECSPCRNEFPEFPYDAPMISNKLNDNTK